LIYLYKCIVIFVLFGGRGSLVVIGNRQDVDGPVFETREARDFLYTCPDLPWGPPSLLYKGYRGSLPGLKRRGHSDDHPV